MIGPTFAREWEVAEVGLSLVANGPGELRTNVSTFVASEPGMVTTIGEEKYAVNGLPMYPRNASRANDVHGSQVANTRLNYMRVIRDELLDSLPNVTEGHGIRGIHKRALDVPVAALTWRISSRFGYDLL